MLKSFLGAALAALFIPTVVYAQAPPVAGSIDGPAAPDQPNVMARTPDGKSTVRAIKLGEPLRFDGRLDDRVYSQYAGFEGMVQVAPLYNVPSTEKTEIWVMFDGDNIYVAAKCWDSAPPEKWIANELRRDTNQMRNTDHFGVGFDTFYDRRNGFMFYANPIGGFADYSTVDEGAPNTDWNPVWTAKTGRFDGGWTVEMQFPFKSLRYRSGSNQVWGIQFRRSIRRKNEWTYWTPVPRQMAGPQALGRVSVYGTLAGLDLPPASRNLELKPYALARDTTDRARDPRAPFDADATIGGDIKYGITANLTADLTINTDFAQVEIDEQQVNLTRFNLQFPEKRDFFLEGRGLFDFARGGAGGGGAGVIFSSGFGFVGGSSDTPQLFYSRRIGLTANRVIPIDAGARLTGKVAGWGIGLMNLETRDEAVSGTPATNFTVMRIKRDILRRSSIGAMFTNRSQSTVTRGGSNQAFGADVALGFFQNVSLAGYYARTGTTSVTGDAASYQAKFDWQPDRYGFSAEHLKVGKAFNPEVGFLRRTDFTRSFIQGRFSPRPRNSRRVRKYTYQGSLEYYENGFGDVESRQQTGRFNVEFNNSDTLTVEANANYDLLLRPFSPAAGATVGVGAYHYNDATVTYSVGAQRRLSGNVAVQAGEFYNGTIKAVTFSNGRIGILKQFSVEPRISYNVIELPTGTFKTRVFGARTDYGFSPRMFFSTLLQYGSNDHTFSSNVRFRWEYRPGSDFFVVWTDEHDTNPLDPHDRLNLRNRAFVVKMTRLLRF